MVSNAAKKIIILKGFSHSSVSRVTNASELKQILATYHKEFDTSNPIQIIENESSDTNAKFIQILRFVEESIVFDTMFYELT